MGTNYIERYKQGVIWYSAYSALNSFTNHNGTVPINHHEVGLTASSTKVPRHLASPMATVSFLADWGQFYHRRYRLNWWRGAAYIAGAMCGRSLSCALLGSCGGCAAALHWAGATGGAAAAPESTSSHCSCLWAWPPGARPPATAGIWLARWAPLCSIYWWLRLIAFPY